MTLVLAGAGTFEYLVDLDVLTFAALETSVTRVRYRQKSEDANTSATILGLMGGKDGKKAFDKMLTAFAGAANDPDSAAEERTSRGVADFKAAFAGGGF